jgi:hypothetical protein
MYLFFKKLNAILKFKKSNVTILKMRGTKSKTEIFELTKAFDNHR